MELAGVKALYTQEPDAASAELCHAICLERVDNGGGPYLVISTDRWALDPDEVDAFADTLKGFLQGLANPGDYTHIQEIKKEVKELHHEAALLEAALCGVASHVPDRR